MSRRGLILIAMFFLAACNSGNQPPDLVKTQREAMEKAKGVEQVLQQSADKKRDQEEQQK